MLIEGPDILLEPRHLLSVSMILHELMTNALKYGALATETGRVSLKWSRCGDELSIAWIESGVSGVLRPRRRGFGSKMIDLTVGHELRGEATTAWGGDGMTFELVFPFRGAGGKR